MDQYERIARLEAALKLRDLRLRRSRYAAAFFTTLVCLALAGCL